MLIDAFTFFNEYEMLYARLKYLYKHVDYFVISECDHTHAGNFKGFNLTKSWYQFREFQDKIIYLPMSIDPTQYDFTKPKSTDYSAGNWKLEKDQRNHLMKALKLFAPDDYVMISDVDEVCTHRSIKDAIANYLDDIGVVGSDQEMFWYSFKTKESNLWPGTVLTKVKFALQYTPEFFREYRANFNFRMLKGYHMTYFMDIDKMKYKIENFAHQELNQEEFTDVEKIKDRISKNIEPFARPNVPLINVSKNQIDSEIYEIFSACMKV